MIAEDWTYMLGKNDKARRKSVFPRRKKTTTITRSISKLLDNLSDDKQYLTAVAQWENAVSPIQFLFEPNVADSGVKPDFLFVKYRCVDAGLVTELQRVTEAVAKVRKSALNLRSSRDYNEMIEEEISLVKYSDELIPALECLLEKARCRNVDLSILSSVTSCLIAILEAQGIHRQSRASSVVATIS
jgi:hypothetical protein